MRGKGVRERAAKALVNRMGITNCCDEAFGYLPDDVRIASERVYPDALRVLQHARVHVEVVFLACGRFGHTWLRGW